MFDQIITSKELEFNVLEKKVFKFVCFFGCLILKLLLEAVYSGDDIDIQLAIINCNDVVRPDMLFGGDISTMRRYAKYIYDIERSLFV